VLSQALRRLGRPTVAVPPVALAAAGALTRRPRLRRLEAELSEFLTFGRGLDTTRMHEVLGFRPTYSSAEAFADFAASLGPGLLPRRGAAGARRTAGIAVSTGGDRA